MEALSIVGFVFGLIGFITAVQTSKELKALKATMHDSSDVQQ